MANYELVDTSGGTEYYEGSGTFDGNSNGKDHITGSDGSDTINAGNGDDTIIGSGGDDLLTGGNGADTFQYSYTMESGSGGSGPQSYAAYLAALGVTLDSQNVFSTTYSAWLNYLVFGGEDGWQGLVEHFGWEGEVTIGLNQNDLGGSQPHILVDGVQQDLDAIFGDVETFSWTKGKATQTRSFWDLDGDYDWGGTTTVSSGDGKDTITDFSVDLIDPTKSDKLFFTVDIEGDGTGLTTEQEAALIETFKAQFEVTTGFYDSGTTTDTRLTLDDDMSITLLGYAGGEGIWSHVVFDFI